METKMGEFAGKQAGVKVCVEKTNGSSPRKAGAWMIVCENGKSFGSIGGGDLELFCVRLALEACKTKSSFVREFKLDSAKSSFVREFKPDSAENGEKSSAQNDEKCEKDENREKCGDKNVAKNGGNGQKGCEESDKKNGDVSKIGDDEDILTICNDGISNISMICDDGVSMICGGNVTVSFTYADDVCKIIPNEKRDCVYIFGGGHVGGELVPILEHLGFDVTLLDNRPEFANSELHPKAARCVVCDYSDIYKSVQISKNDYVVIMTHGHIGDSEILLQVLKTDAFYIGCIGSKKKVEATKQFLAEHGISEQNFSRVHMPVGIEIYGDTPQEIAISVAAEIIQQRAIKNGLDK